MGLKFEDHIEGSDGYDPRYEVGDIADATGEWLEKRIQYETDYVSAHHEIFSNSSGLKPLGTGQRESVERSRQVICHGGRIVILEPRGLGKTSRTTNNALLAALQGKAKYVLILTAAVDKSTDILESIYSELVGNEKLAQLYPRVCACFHHIADYQLRGKRQTFNGRLTGIMKNNRTIMFPCLDGEPSSGSIIQVRTKDNVRGLKIKIKFGPNAGKEVRPDLVFMDDIQTDEEAESPTTVRKIVGTIKKSILFSGSHSRRTSVIMCCTPIFPGDVPTHFVINEPSWEVCASKLLIKMPKNMDMWLGPYRDILFGFDRHKSGDRKRAQLSAKQYVLDNYEALHDDAVPAWDWAYGWQEDPQVEVSAVHHAMNFYIEEGAESFETECQCNVQIRQSAVADIKATTVEIANKVHQWERFQCPVETQHICTHIDVNKEILTYATIGSSPEFKPHLLDFGTFPPQPGVLWKKTDLVNPLSAIYPELTEEDRIYQGVKELINLIGKTTYKRDDGVELHNGVILTDVGYKIDEVQRAMRDSNFKNLCHGARGQGISAKKKQFDARQYGQDCVKYHRCALVPSHDKTSRILYCDSYYWKTMFHRGIKTKYGLANSFSLFTPASVGDQMLYAKHCIAEDPQEDINEEEKLHVITWSNIQKWDNEFFDNTCTAFAGLFHLGCFIRTNKSSGGTINMQDYINRQKKKKDE